MQLEVLRVVRGRDQHLVRDLGVELGDAAPQHPVHARARTSGRRDSARWSSRASATCAGSTCATATRSHAVARQRRRPRTSRRSPGRRDARRLAASARSRASVAEHAAGLGEEAVGLLGALEVGDVLDHVDREPHIAAGVEHGRRLHARPAVLRAAVVAVAHGQRPGALACQRSAPRQAVERDRLAVASSRISKRSRISCGRRRQQLLRAVEAEQAAPRRRWRTTSRPSGDWAVTASATPSRIACELVASSARAAVCNRALSIASAQRSARSWAARRSSSP